MEEKELNEEVVTEERPSIDEDYIHDKSVKVIDMTKKVQNSFLDYAMSVIVSRALPDVRDGLKPVHRRIIYSMNELGLQPNKAYKKSARIVGDTMGKYHPHGDSSIYEALVRLAQDFSTRYLLVDGHGNFGSVDGDGAAAMRYTEARMAKITMEMIRDIDRDTVDFMDNYDASEQEPVVLPSRVPNLLINGATGIAVGMATNIPPHNLGEVIDALLAMLDNPEITVDELMMNYIYGPDFPTGGIILGRGGIKKAYDTGNGSIVIRSKCSIEKSLHNANRFNIIVSELPYQVNKQMLIQKIAELVKNKIVEGISDVRDESNREGIRVVIELKKDVVPEVILNQLYKLTQLQTSYGINSLVIDKGVPKVMSIKDMLNAYLDHQEEVITRRSNYLLKQYRDRIHVLQGLKVACDNIDEVISIIRASKSAAIASESLMERFELTQIQAKAILDMQLHRLTGLELEGINNDIEKLQANIDELEGIISDRTKLVALLKEELEEVRKYSDERRTEITNDFSDIDDEDLIPREDIVITLTEKGYIKRVTTDTYKSQNRGGRGIKGMTTHDDDLVERMLIANTHTDILFFTNTGRVYRIRGYKIPEFSRQSKGLPIINLLKMDKTEKVRAMISIDSDSIVGCEQLMFVSVKGISKRVDIEEFKNIRQNGKIAVSLKDGDELFTVKKTNGDEDVLIAASNGKLVRFNEAEIRSMGRTASGVKSINVGDGEVVGVTTSSEGKYVLVLTNKGYGKMSEMDEYRVMAHRGGKGVTTIKSSEKNGHLVCMKAVNGDEDLLIVTNKGVMIRVPLEQVKIASRNTQGVRVIRLDGNSEVSSLEVTAKEEEEVIEEATPTSETVELTQE